MLIRLVVVTSGDEKSLQSYLDMTQNTALRSIQLGVPTYRDAGFISAWLTAVLAQVTSPAIEEVRFAIYPILKGDAKNAATMLQAFAWKDIVAVLQRPQFVTLKRVMFVSGRSMDYMQVPSAFVSLQSVLQEVIPEVFEPLVKNGAETMFQCM
jgi:hypothetical protein